VPDSDFYFVPADTPDDGMRKVIQLVTERIPARFGLDPIADIQVLAPMNRGGLGVRSLNLALQRAINPPGEAAVERFGWTFGPGDKVMQIVNDYERDVYNGDIGVVSSLDAEAGALTVAFEGREVAYAFGELDELVLAYATTIHKAQGSEYPAVVIPLTMAHAHLLRRDLLYTALTRGKRLVVLVGSREALALAVGRGRGEGRHSRLGAWLREGVGTEREGLSPA
jgi:exodeoxyribonuclease V alpha subunit